MTPSRRDALLAVAATVFALPIAGCAAFGGTSRGVTDVFVENRTSTSRTVSLTVTYADGNIAIDETFALDPGEETKINNEVVMQTETTVEVQVEDGPSGTYDWSAAFDALYVTITDEAVTFEEAP